MREAGERTASARRGVNVLALIAIVSICALVGFGILVNHRANQLAHSQQDATAALRRQAAALQVQTGVIRAEVENRRRLLKALLTAQNEAEFRKAVEELLSHPVQPATGGEPSRRPSDGSNQTDGTTPPSSPPPPSTPPGGPSPSPPSTSPPPAPPTTQPPPAPPEHEPLVCAPLIHLCLG